MTTRLWKENPMNVLPELVNKLEAFAFGFVMTMSLVSTFLFIYSCFK